MSKKQSYKERNGVTRVGAFLNSIGKSEVLKKVLSVGGELLTGDVTGAVSKILKDSKDLDEAETKYALSLLEHEAEGQREATSRHSADMLSDSFLSKNIRPIVLIYSWFLLSLMIFFTPDIKDSYVSLIEMLCLTVNGFYFTGRALLHIQKIRKK